MNGVLCIVKRDHQRYLFVIHLPGILKAFSWSKIRDLRVTISKMEELLPRKKEQQEKIIVWTLEKGKLKTKMLSKVTIADEQEPSV